MKHPAIKPGDRFGFLVVIEVDETPKRHRERMWVCLCDCGRRKSVRASALKRAKTKSCGSCRLVRDAMPRRNIKHGGKQNNKPTRTYDQWRKMKQRCYSANYPGYRHYGGAGIKVCDRWRDSFANFLADMGEAPEGMVLRRHDNARDFEPGNCYWGPRLRPGKAKKQDVQPPVVDPLHQWMLAGAPGVADR